MKKYFSGLIVGAVVVLMVNVFLIKYDEIVCDSKEARTDRIAFVLRAAWDEFGLVSFQIGDTDPTIWIGMGENKSEQNLREYLKVNIDKYDLIHYNIEIFKEGLPELETEHSIGIQNKKI